MATDVDIDEMVASIRQLVDTIEDLLKYGRDCVQESKEEFINGKISKLFGMAVAYDKCFKRLGVATKDELERKIHRHSRNADLRDMSNEMLDVEQEWDSFLTDIDKNIEGDYSTVKDMITSANGRVIVVSFGLQEGATRWLEDVHCPFPMLLDSERKVYHTFGLKRSVQKVWGVASLVYYAEAMVAGKPLPKPYENVHDDFEQMGGDFILNSTGAVTFLYPSKTNKDRPSVELLIENLKKNQSCKL